jgi:hypothetical protein
MAKASKARRPRVPFNARDMKFERPPKPFAFRDGDTLENQYVGVRVEFALFQTLVFPLANANDAEGTRYVRAQWGEKFNDFMDLMAFVQERVDFHKAQLALLTMAQARGFVVGERIAQELDRAGVKVPAPAYKRHAAGAAP